LKLTVLLLPLFLFSASAAEDRITAPLDAARRIALPRQVHPRATAQAQIGPVDPAEPISGISLLFKPAPGLEAFLALQQIPGSPDYHRWLTPEQFGLRFGLSDQDLAKVRAWLEGSGLHVDRVARGRLWIEFSGTAATIGRALHTTLRRYQIDGVTRFANSAAPEVPAALAPIAGGFLGLNNIPHPASPIRPMPLANTAGGGHAVAPDDLAMIYNLGPLYTAGINGAGQRIAIVGDSGFDVTDVRLFRRTFSLPARDPQITLVGRDPGVNADNFEAIADIELAGAVAPNAQIVYLYSTSALGALAAAADNVVAPVISMSFGACEAFADLSMRAVAQQANAQGITVVAASGDWGAATCDQLSPTPQASRGVSASFPADLPEVTAVGGTEFNEGNGRYWTTTQTITLESAMSYIPETVWNDSALVTSLKSAAGGGPSAMPKPWWQSAPGVPSDGARDLPDVSLNASYLHDGYLVVYSGTLYTAGGTSASAPAFAGIVALLNQSLAARGQVTGAGNINPGLYRLAQTAPTVFHDITFGNNNVPCAQGSPGCVNGGIGFSAGPGYDLATGLGSIDVQKMISAWTAGAASSTTLASDKSKAGTGDTVNLTASVTGQPGIAPTGPVTFLVQNGIDAVLATADLSASDNGASATVAVDASRIIAGSGTVVALYAGDPYYAASSGSITIGTSVAGSGSMVVAFATPSPSGLIPALGYWPLDIVLSEKAGVATTLTGFSTNGTPQSLSFFSSTSIPAGGVVVAALAAHNLTPDTDVTLHFTGIDPGGVTWSRDLVVHLSPAPPSLPAPGITLAGSPATVQQNPQADPSCQWSHQLVVHETGGYTTLLTTLRRGSVDLSGNIQQLFGTTRLAPFGTLAANICLPGTSGSGGQLYQLTGVTEVSATVTASAAVNYAAAAVSPAAASLSPSALTLLPDTPATLTLSFAGGSPPWTISVVPAQPAWLTLSKASGTGSGAITVTGSASGLSPGAWTATLVVQSSGAVPQALNVAVTLVVGLTGTISIGGVAHGASFTQTFAPGMVLSAFGSQIAPAVQVATGLPLPLSLGGVSATVNGVSAPLYFVSPTQINLQVPYETGVGPAVLAINNNGLIAVFPFTVSVTAPGIFTASDGSLAPNVSGARGSVLLAFITGDGDQIPTLATGATPPASTALSSLPRPRLPLTITVGGVNADIAFVGVPPGLAGVTQINFTVPPGAPTGDQPVVVTVGGVASKAATLTVQ
jgi:uncharacterized protein (TIGR03437 family)